MKSSVEAVTTQQSQESSSSSGVEGVEGEEYKKQDTLLPSTTPQLQQQASVSISAAAKVTTENVAAATTSAAETTTATATTTAATVTATTPAAAVAGMTNKINDGDGVTNGYPAGLHFIDLINDTSENEDKEKPIEKHDEKKPSADLVVSPTSVGDDNKSSGNQKVSNDMDNENENNDMGKEMDVPFAKVDAQNETAEDQKPSASLLTSAEVATATTAETATETAASTAATAAETALDTTTDTDTAAAAASVSASASMLANYHANQASDQLAGHHVAHSFNEQPPAGKYNPIRHNKLAHR